MYYIIRLTQDGYEAYEKTIVIGHLEQGYLEPNRLHVDFNLISGRTGDVHISSSPSGADVFIDGVCHGVTPITISDIAVGDHDIAVTKPGYIDYLTVRSITVKKLAQVDALLKRIELSVNSSPTGADIYLDGSYRGVTPLKIFPISPGFHIVKLTKSKYNTFTSSLTIKAGMSSEINADLNQSSEVKKSPTVTIKITDTPILTPQPSSNETTNITESTTKATLLVPSVIAGIMIAGILVVKRKKGF